MSRLFSRYFGMCFTGGSRGLSPTMGLGINLASRATGNAVTRRISYLPRSTAPRYVRSRAMRFTK